MSEAKQVDIKIYCGEDFDMSFIHRNTEQEVVDLTGATIRAIVREYPSGDDPHDMTVTNYGASGKVRLQMQNEMTAELSYAYGTYEVDCTYPDDSTETLLWGRVFVVPAVTRITTGTPEIILAFNSFDEFPEVGTYFRLYLDIEAGLLYRWNGTMYENALIGLKGDKGDDGRGIVSIRKISTTDNVDRYEITYTDDSTSYFFVTNGTSIATIQKTGTAGLVDTYTVTLTNGDTTTFTVTNGNFIESITKTDTEGLVDTYTILMVDGETHTFQVRNGEDGLGSLVRVTDNIAYVSTLDTFEDAIVAPAFDESATYTTGDYVMHNNALYQFTQNHTGEWDSAHVEAVTVGNELKGKSDTSHTHDDRYYTKTEADALLADKADSADLGAMASVADAPSDGSEYVRKNGAWAVSSGGGGGAPVWGGITGTLADQTDLNTALGGKQNTLTFDSTPTASSTNPVTSGGVKTALDALDDSKVSKSGDTMTGNLVISGDGKTLRFVPTDTSKMSLAQIAVRNNERLMFWHRTSGNDGNELYQLPAMDTSASGNNYYDILTSKTPVTLAQGGTGGTDSGWQSYTDSNVFTGTIYYRKVGVFFMIVGQAIKLANALTAGNSLLLMTLSSAYRPTKEIMPSCFINTGSVQTMAASMRLAYTGGLYLYANKTDDITSSYNIYFSGFGFM